MTAAAPRNRGVRLSELDRRQVYRIGYTGRRWEVLGPEGAGGAGAGPETDVPAGGAPEAGPAGAYVPRHAGPAGTTALSGSQGRPSGVTEVPAVNGR